MTTALAATRFDSRLSRRVFRLVSHVACLPDVKAAVEANHDENRWWPTRVTDPRMRMLVAGWSTRVSYRMVDVYARVVAEADALGMERLIALSDEHVVHLVAPIGLPGARTRYLRSLVAFLDHMDAEGVDPVSADIDELIGRFAAAVDQASFKVAQCALLYARGYHCGVIPVDSGMVTKLAPVLGISLPAGPVAHELMRMLLQDCVSDRAAEYRRLADEQRYNVHLPVGSPPMWWTHLVLIYFKRLYLNHPEPRLCPARPVCDAVLDCRHSGQPDRAAPTRSPPHSGPLRAIGLSLPTRFRRRRVRSRGTAWCRRDDRRLRCQGDNGCSLASPPCPGPSRTAGNPTGGT